MGSNEPWMRSRIARRNRRRQIALFVTVCLIGIILLGVRAALWPAELCGCIEFPGQIPLIETHDGD